MGEITLQNVRKDVSVNGSTNVRATTAKPAKEMKADKPVKEIKADKKAAADAKKTEKKAVADKKKADKKAAE